ncbi:hypothetical protein RAS2_19440 [Phycisphaerae bacterium RAS2]|nr:hypothetical protein RAS2_19440 [Phycisphaerae bacterium RAS2]
MAMWRVEQLLRKATEALNASGVQYAVVGGNAIAAWVATVDPDAVRATKDVDILARRSDLPRMAEALKSIGMEQTEVFGVVVFIDPDDPSPKRGVHFVAANERVRPHYMHPAPNVTEVTKDIAPYPVVSLSALIGMKLQSGRPIDIAHLVDMKSVGLITPDLASKLPPDLRTKLAEVPEPDTH